MPRVSHARIPIDVCPHVPRNAPHGAKAMPTASPTQEKQESRPDPVLPYKKSRPDPVLQQFFRPDPVLHRSLLPFTFVVDPSLNKHQDLSPRLKSPSKGCCTHLDLLMLGGTKEYQTRQYAVQADTKFYLCHTTF